MAIEDDLKQSRLEMNQQALASARDLQARLDSDWDLYIDILTELIPLYMKPTTATLEDSMRSDALRDAKYLGIAADAVLAELKARRATLD